MAAFLGARNSLAVMMKTVPNKSKMLPSADEIAEMATRGEDVSKFFAGQFTVVRPVRRVNVDLTQGMLRELDGRDQGPAASGVGSDHPCPSSSSRLNK